MNKVKMELLKFRLSTCRWQFWAWVMDNHPRLYRWCEKYLPIDTLPF